MCYGDPEHGNDGYYQEFLERQYREEMEKRAQAEDEHREYLRQVYDESST